MTETIGVDRYAALLVGLGGTGMKVLRSVLWIAEHGSDERLREMVQLGHLQVLGMDTDRGSNREEEEVDEGVFENFGDVAGLNRRLPVVPNIVMIDTADIRTALDSLRRAAASERFNRRARTERRAAPNGGGTGARPDPDSGAEPVSLDIIADWLPPLDTNEGDELMMGHVSFRGAGQWRPLGRIGAFLKAGTIQARLEEQLQLVKNVAGPDPVRVFVIGSLAGGTGSGMFWDIAFMTRMIDESAYVTGSFLLSGPFTPVDRAERVEVNTYAALKEIAAYKNWRVEKPLSVTYPIGELGRRYTGSAGSPSVFDSVYIYDASPPLRDPAEITDVHGSTISVSCHRIAENILTQLRTDIRGRLDIGANNEKGDTNALFGEETGTYAFSTSVSAVLEGHDTNLLARTLLVAHLQLIEQRLTSADRSLVDWDYFWRIIAGGNPTGQSQTKTTGVEPPATIRRSAHLVELWAEKHKNKKPKTPAWIVEQQRNLVRLREQVAGMSEKHPDTQEKIARSLYQELVSKDLQSGWREAILSGERPLRGPIVARLGSLADLYEKDIDAELKGLARRVDDIVKTMRDKLLILHDGVKEFLEGSIEAIDTRAAIWDHASRQAAAAEATGPDAIFLPESRVPVRAPPHLVQMRVELNLIDQNRNDDQLLREKHERYGGGPLELVLTEFAESLDLELEHLNDQYNRDQMWEDAVIAFLVKHKDRFKGLINAVLEQNDWNTRLLDDRIQQIRRFIAEFWDLRSDTDEALIKFNEVMAELPRLLKELLNDPNERAFTVMVQDMLKVMGEEATQLLGSAPPHLRVGDIFVERWARVMKSVEAEARRQAEERLAAPRTFVQQFLAAIDPGRRDADSLRIVPKLDTENFQDARSFGEYLSGLEALHTGFVRYWLEQEGFLVARLGGSEGLQRRLQNCRSEVFVNGILVPTIQKSKLVVSSPKEGRYLPLSRSLQIRDELATEFRQAAQTVLHIIPRFCEPSTAPVIYFEDMFRSPLEIASIRDLQASYLALPKEKRAFLHFHKDAVDLPEMFSEREVPRVILCGNNGCDHNIRNLSRDTLICPSCDRPILNWCGNPDCGEVALYDRLGLTSNGNSDAIPFQCPECEGPLHTYWWYCDDERHSATALRTHIDECPQCLEEVHRDERSEQDISRFNLKADIECPGCRNMDPPPAEPVRIPYELRKFFEKGVTPAEQPSFLNLIAKHKFHPHLCSNQAKLHYLFPTYTGDPKKSQGRREWLYQTERGFVAPSARTVKFHTCFHCSYPISAEEVKRLDGSGAITCPRCMRALTRCAFCSHTDGKLFMPKAGGSGMPARCPRCGNHMNPTDQVTADYVTRGQDRPGFCPNLFGCNAGAQPWATVTDHALGTCRCCDDRSNAAQLLRYDELASHVERCPICLTLIGLLVGNAVKRFKPAELLQWFLDERLLSRSHLNLRTDCDLCGTEPATVLRWMCDGDYFLGDQENDVSPSDVNRLREATTQVVVNPVSLPVSETMEALEWMLGGRNNRQLYDAIRTLRRFKNYASRDLETEFKRLFGNPSISQRTVLGKLRDVNRQFDEEDNRRKLNRRIV